MRGFRRRRRGRRRDPRDEGAADELVYWMVRHQVELREESVCIGSAGTCRRVRVCGQHGGHARVRNMKGSRFLVRRGLGWLCETVWRGASAPNRVPEGPWEIMLSSVWATSAGEYCPSSPGAAGITSKVARKPTPLSSSPQPPTPHAPAYIFSSSSVMSAPGAFTKSRIRRR